MCPSTPLGGDDDDKLYLSVKSSSAGAPVGDTVHDKQLNISFWGEGNTRAP